MCDRKFCVKFPLYYYFLYLQCQETGLLSSNQFWRNPEALTLPGKAAVTVLIHADDELAVSSMANCITKEYLAAAVLSNNTYFNMRLQLLFSTADIVSWTSTEMGSDFTHHFLVSMPCPDAICVPARNSTSKCAWELTNYWLSAGHVLNLSPKGQWFQPPFQFNFT